MLFHGVNPQPVGNSGRLQNVLFCYLDIPFDSTDNDTIDHPFAKEDLLVNGKGSDRRLEKAALRNAAEVKGGKRE